MGGALPAQVDWRNYRGWPWITPPRNQRPCKACTAFATVALVESMVRIEHAVWCARSEGDLHGRAGGRCKDFENVFRVAAAAIFDGIADPDCFRWQGEATGAPPLPYAPTRDRAGRVVRTALPWILQDFDNCRVWLATVGPLLAFFELYEDLYAYGSGCYKHITGDFKGFHAVLIVGYDDLDGCWIAKNSWYKDDGTLWGDQGFFKIAYGECRIDQLPKLGLRGTNPDPWTKRRLHNGCLLESGNGSSHRDFELFYLKSGQVRHRRRENSTAPFSWQSVGQFATPDAATMPAATASTYNRDFELVYRRTAASGGGLHHWRFSQTSRKWVDGGIFGPSNAASVPGFIQSNHNAPGDFEVVVKTASTGPVQQLSHWTRENGYTSTRPRGTWYPQESFGSNVAASGPALVQSHVGITELPENGLGRLEVVCVLNDGFMEHFSRAPGPGASWQSEGTFGEGGAHGPPCMIEGQFNCPNEWSLGDFELCVAVGDQFQHWRWSDPPGPGARSWNREHTYGSNVKEVVALIESSFTFQLELIVLRTDDRLQHYWRAGAGWHAGDILP
ncbi:MAG: peptidase C1A [Chloroflexi bacterium]|nr:peptidase C1A [Chloroflexota bacterium]